MIFDQLWGLERKLKRLQNERSRILKRLRKEPGSAGIAIITEKEKPAWDAAGWEISTTRSEIEGIRTTRLIQKARSLGLPTPIPSITDDEAIEDDTWERDSVGSYHLSLTAQSDLRRLIRIEEKERREALAFWVKDILVPVLSLVLGIIGAATGYLAVFRK